MDDVPKIKIKMMMMMMMMCYYHIEVKDIFFLNKVILVGIF